MDSVLRPRDIQARIRSGESPETVAAAAQTSVEKIMPFAGPVLAERAFVAQQAQRASVRRRAGEGAPGQLGTAVAERLSADEVDPEAVEWDAWRRDDGRWTLVAAYDAASGPERAEFVYDAAGRYVTATDESSRRLVGERLPAAPADIAAPGTPAAPVGLVAVPSEPAPDQLHLGDDAIELVTGRRPEPPAEPPAETPVGTPVEPAVAQEVAPEEHSDEQADGHVDDRDEVTVDLTEPATALRQARPVADPDWMATQASERPPVAEAEALFEVPPPAPDEEAEQDPEPDPGPVPEPDAEQDAEGEPTHASRRPRPARAKPARAAKGAKGRAAIPSWDEIMFGGSSAGD